MNNVFILTYTDGHSEEISIQGDSIDNVWCMAMGIISNRITTDHGELIQITRKEAT